MRRFTQILSSNLGSKWRITMAACLGAHPSFNSCASLGVDPIHGSNSSFLSASPRPLCFSFPIKVKPLLQRRRLVVKSLGETPVKDTGLRDMVDKNMADANEEFSEMDVREAAEKYSLEEQLFTEVDYAQINAFTDRAFSGNPAAVIFLPYERNDRWLQTIAREFNHLTAFLVKRYNSRTDVLKQNGKGLVQGDESGSGLKARKSDDPLPEENEFDLRWFTATKELDICGHGTLASAHLLFSAKIVEGDSAIFHTKSGVLTANKVCGYNEADESPEDEDSSNSPERKKPSSMGVVELDFPLEAATECDDGSLLSEALGGVEVKWVGRSNLGDYLVELQSSEDVVNVIPNLERIMALPGRGVIVTAPAAANSEYDFISRFFGPNIGIDEDSATGSSHCTLGPYWATKLGKTELNAYQASDRGGKFFVRVDADAGRCYLQGGAILVMLGVCLNSKQILVVKMQIFNFLNEVQFEEQDSTQKGVRFGRPLRWWL